MSITRVHRKKLSSLACHTRNEMNAVKSFYLKDKGYFLPLPILAMVMTTSVVDRIVNSLVFFCFNAFNFYVETFTMNDQLPENAFIFCG